VDPELKVKLLRAAAVRYDEEEPNTYCLIVCNPDNRHDILYEIMRLHKFDIIDDKIFETRYSLVVWRYAVILIKATSDTATIIKKIASDRDGLTLIFKDDDGDFVLAGPESVIKRILSEAKVNVCDVNIVKMVKDIVFVESYTVLFKILPRQLRHLLNILVGIEEDLFSLMVVDTSNSEDFKKYLENSEYSVYWKELTELRKGNSKPTSGNK